RPASPRRLRRARGSVAEKAGRASLDAPGDRGAHSDHRIRRGGEELRKTAFIPPISWPLGLALPPATALAHHGGFHGGPARVGPGVGGSGIARPFVTRPFGSHPFVAHPRPFRSHPL